MLLQNTLKVFTSIIGIVWIILGGAIIALPGYYFMEKELIIGNLGYPFYITELTLTVIISLLFGLFLGATLYKMKYFSIKKSWIGVIGWFLWVLVSGCPACSITLASYLGFAGFMYIFPYSWLELKFLSVAILLYANYTTIKNLEVCSLQR